MSNHETEQIIQLHATLQAIIPFLQSIEQGSGTYAQMDVDLRKSAAEELSTQLLFRIQPFLTERIDGIHFNNGWEFHASSYNPDEETHRLITYQALWQDVYGEDAQIPAPVI